MSRPQLPVKKAGVAFDTAVRNFAGGTVGVYTSNEITNEGGYVTLILRTMPNTKVGSGTLDIKVQAYDDLSATWYDIAGASLAQISANRTTPIDLVLGKYTAVANRVVAQPVPNRCRVIATLGASGTDGFTFGVSYELHN